MVTIHSKYIEKILKSVYQVTIIYPKYLNITIQYDNAGTCLTMYMYMYGIPYLKAFQHSVRLSALRKNFLKVTVYIECFAADEDILTHIFFFEHMPDEVLATQMRKK